MEEKKKKLEELRKKWTGKVPNPNAHNYWEFRVDKNHALKLKGEIDREEALIRHFQETLFS